MQGLFPPPGDIGAPSRYTEWRHGQDRAFERSQLTSKRFEVWALPTGIGKSLMAVVKARFNGGRAAILTSTKGLQDQYVRDFKEIGLRDVRGMGNYPCPMLGGDAMCDAGPCLDGQFCRLREQGCPYYDAVKDAKAGELIVTNYAWWMTQKRNGGDPLGPLDMLVLDEGHEAAEEVTGFMQVTLNPGEFKVPQEKLTMDEWRQWARVEAGRYAERLAAMKGAGPLRRRVREQHARLKRLAESTGHWVWERNTRTGGVTLEPLWPKEYTRDWIWGDIPKVVIASATVRPKDLEKLGIARGDYEWIEMPSPFPLSRRPVIHVPTVRMNRFAGEGEIGLWLDRIDQIIEGRLDRKGIIHTWSYERARLLLERSQWRGLMVTHKDSKGTKDAFVRFNRMAAPAILVSPSIHTGFDFPYEAARYQIIGKVPFPDSRSAITRARIDDDPAYTTYKTLQTLVQMAGRIVRAPDDFGETFIVDDSVRMVWAPQNRAFVPAYFLESFRTVKAVPPAPDPDINDSALYEIEL